MSLQGLLLCKLAPSRTGPLQDPALSQALGEASPNSGRLSILGLFHWLCCPRAPGRSNSGATAGCRCWAGAA